MDGWMKRKGSAMGDGGLGSAGQDPAAKIRRGWRARIGRGDPMAKIGRPKLLQEAISVGSRPPCRQLVWPELAGAGRRRRGLAGPVWGWFGRLEEARVRCRP